MSTELGRFHRLRLKLFNNIVALLNRSATTATNKIKKSNITILLYKSATTATTNIIKKTIILFSFTCQVVLLLVFIDRSMFQLKQPRLFYFY